MKDSLPELIAKGRAQLEKLWEILEPEVCTRVKTHNTQTLEDYEELPSTDVANFLEAYATEVWNAAIDAGLEALPKERPGIEVNFEEDNEAAITNKCIHESRTNLQALKQ